MTEHPKFVCAREGHKYPIVTVTTTVEGSTLVQVCLRCGAAAEMPIQVKR